MSVDERGADRRPLEQTEVACGSVGEAAAQRGAGHDDLVSDLRVTVGSDTSESDPFEIALAPALLVGDKIPFASERAYRTRRRPGSLERKIVGEIEEMPGRIVGRRQVFLQPKKLGNLHFGRDRAADIAKNVVAGIIDETGFSHRAMVHPDDDIASCVARRADRERIAAGVEYHERTSRIETYALDGGRRNRGFRHCGAGRGDARCPDLGRRLFDDVPRLMPNRDRMPGRRQKGSLLVEHPGARARCPNVDTDEGLPHSNPIQDMPKPTSTYSLHRRERCFRSSGLLPPTPETGRLTRLRRPLPSGPWAYRRSRHHTSSDCSLRTH